MLSQPTFPEQPPRRLNPTGVGGRASSPAPIGGVSPRKAYGQAPHRSGASKGGGEDLVLWAGLTLKGHAAKLFGSGRRDARQLQSLLQLQSTQLMCQNRSCMGELFSAPTEGVRPQRSPWFQSLQSPLGLWRCLLSAGGSQRPLVLGLLLLHFDVFEHRSASIQQVSEDQSSV